MVVTTGRGDQFVAVVPGQPFAGSYLTEKGAKEVNAYRYEVANGDKGETVGEKLFSHLSRKQQTQELFQKLTEGEKEIFPRRISN